MIRIFVINLKSSVERRKTMEKQLNRLGLSFEIFDAVNGADLSDNEITSYFDMNFYNHRPHYYTPGLSGCILSHYFLYKKMVDEKIDVALILEDDMILNKNLLQLFEQLSKEIRNDEVNMLFYQSRFPINLSQNSVTPLNDKFNLYQVISTKGLRSTAGYLITFDAANSMLKGLRPFSAFPNEWKSFYDRNLVNGIRVVYPSLLSNTYQTTAISPNKKGGAIAKTLLSLVEKNLVEKNKVFPFYQLLKWRRMKNIAKSRQCFILSDPIIDFRKK